MSWGKVDGNRKEDADGLKRQWGKLTDDDFIRINGRRDGIEECLQQQHGYAKDQARKEVDFWLGRY